MTLEEYLEKIDKEEAYKLPEDILKDEGTRNLSSTDLKKHKSKRNEAKCNRPKKLDTFGAFTMSKLNKQQKLEIYHDWKLKQQIIY